MKGVTPVILILGLIIIAAAIGISYGSITGFFTFTPQQSAAHDANVSDSGGRGLVIGDAVPRATGGEPATQQNETQAGVQKGAAQQNTTTNQTTQNRTPATQFSWGSSGGGDGGGGAPSSPPCSPSWSCTAWSQCSLSGSQSRTCTDVNQCGTGSGKPAETQACEYVPDDSNEKCNGFCVIPKYMSLKKSENSSFDIFIKINTTADVFAASFVLSFNNSILNATVITEGGFLKKDGASTFPTSKINDSMGEVEFGSTRFGTPAGVSENGTLAVISFDVLGSGTSELKLDDAYVVGPDLAPINITVYSGTITIKG